jgi:hypothetical protein
VLRVLSAAAAKLRDFARFESSGSSSAVAAIGSSAAPQSVGKFKALDGINSQIRRL